MNTKKLMILVSLFATQAMATEANELTDTFYFGIKGGYQVLDDDKSHASSPDGTKLGAYGGVRLSDNLSWDLGYQNWESTKLDAHKIDVDMIESALRYDAYINEKVSLYGRAGIGYAFVDSTSAQGDKDYDGVSPLAEVGINYWLSDKLSTGLSYQYIRAVGGNDDLDLDSNSLNLSVTYNFTNRFKYETVEAVTQEPIATAVTVIELQDATLFGFDSFDLTSAGKEHLLNIIGQIPEQSTAVFNIVGHTDSSGPEEYNMKLSERRAQAVKDFLVQSGLADVSITVEGKGETQPIASNDSLQGRMNNRRVEITVDYRMSRAQ